MSTNRTRAIDILNYRPVDRLPAVHFGYWYELLVEWAEQGHIPFELSQGNWDGTTKEKELDKLLGWDHNWCNNFGGDNGLRPKFEFKIIERLPDGMLRTQNADGLIERIREGAHGIPAEDDYQLKDRDAWEQLYRSKMQYSDERVDIQFFQGFNAAREAWDFPVGLNAGSVLGSLRNIFSVIGLSYTLADDYDLVAEIVDAWADMQYRVNEKILSLGARFDFAHFWEDVCFKNGPLVGPVMFDDLCAKHYRRASELFRKNGINIVSLDCDGVVEKLIPTWLDNGVNTLFPIEIGTWGDQFEPARKKYGKSLLGVGGVDKTALRKDKAAVDQEIERVKRLADLGGFVPCPDHRLMPGTKWELVQYYTDRIKSLKL